MSIGIYKITNKLNNKCYIGQSRNIEQRFRDHRKQCNVGKRTISTAIHKYGVDNFSFEILQECNVEELNTLEIKYIEEYESYGEKGYNMTPGGGDSVFSREVILTKEDVDEITRLLAETDIPQTEISKMFGISTVSSINVGKTHHRNYINYPIRPSKPILAININTKEVCRFPSILIASRELSIGRRNIYTSISSLNQASGYVFINDEKLLKEVITKIDNNFYRKTLPKGVTRVKTGKYYPTLISLARELIEEGIASHNERSVSSSISRALSNNTTYLGEEIKRGKQ